MRRSGMRRAALVAALTLAAALAGWRPLGRSPTALVPPDDPWVRLDGEITEQFGMALPVVWLVEARGDTVWTRGGLARVQAVTQDVLRIPGVIPTDVVSLASPNVRDLRAAGDALEPVYLMPEAPVTDDALATLRRRVERDPMLHGALVSLDGRAALIVANFRDTADRAEIARAALAIRDHHRDAELDVWVVGAPVLRAVAPGAMPRIAAALAVPLAAVAVALGATLGWRLALRAAAAALLAGGWTALAAAATGVFVLPWSAFALLVAIAIAGAACIAGPSARAWPVAVALACGFAGLGLLAGPPAAAFAWTGALGMPLAALAAALLSGEAAARVATDPAWRRPAAGALVLAAAAGAWRLEPAFGLAGYGQRWLPAPAAADLRALGRRFPPPSQLAVRLRGEPGFVAEPTVLHALDAATAAARADPATSGAMSVTDLVALVHQAFGGAEATTRLPGERGLVARYLALAYSPGFRRFVDRGMSRTALWVQLRDDDPRALDRVRGALAARLAVAPLPAGTSVDLVGGDGAVVLVAARGARRFAAGVALLVALAAAVAGLVAGRGALVRAVAAGTAAAAVAAGLAGWFGLGIDLLTLPAAAAATATAVGLAILAGGAPRSALALVAAGALACLLPDGVARLAGILIAAPALAAALVLARAGHDAG